MVERAIKPQMLQKFLLLRRRVDPVLLTIAVACFGVKIGPDKIILPLFCGIGLYLVLIRHRACRLIDKRYAYAALTYGIVVLLLGMYHGQMAENARWLAYPLYFLAAVLLWPGTVLVADPLRQVTLGARFGVVLAIFWSIYEYWISDARIGFGGNAANAAFVIAALAVIARFEIAKAPRYLPNSVLWFYLAILPVLMTGTRVILPIFALAVLVDIFRSRHSLKLAWRPLTPLKLALPGAALIIVCITAFLALNIITQRIDYTLKEIASISEQDDPQSGLTGLEVRVLLWKGATAVVEEHPWLGMGAHQSMQQIVDTVPAHYSEAMRDFIHVHFFVLDELRARGFVGLAFQMIFFGVVFYRLFRHGDANIRTNSALFLALLLLYGSMHGLLQGDRNIGVIVLFFFAALSSIRRGETILRREPDRTGL